MLAKMWKKLLLAICIIAILFNITSKLVYKTNLTNQLKSVIGGSSLSEYFTKNKKDSSLNGEQITDNTNKEITNNNTTINSITTNRVTVVID